MHIYIHAVLYHDVCQSSCRLSRLISAQSGCPHCINTIHTYIHTHTFSQSFIMMCANQVADPLVSWVRKADALIPEGAAARGGGAVREHAFANPDKVRICVCLCICIVCVCVCAYTRRCSGTRRRSRKGTRLC